MDTDSCWCCVRLLAAAYGPSLCCLGLRASGHDGAAYLRPQAHLEPVRRGCLQRPGGAHVARRKHARHRRLHLLAHHDAAVAAKQTGTALRLQIRDEMNPGGGRKLVAAVHTCECPTKSDGRHTCKWRSRNRTRIMRGSEATWLPSGMFLLSRQIHWARCQWRMQVWYGYG